MEEKPILKFVEEPDDTQPQSGNLIKSSEGILYIWKDGRDDITAFNLYGHKIINPYGISEDHKDIQPKDTILIQYPDKPIQIETCTNVTNVGIWFGNGYEAAPKYCRKVLINPQEFNYEDLIELDLKENDKFKPYGKNPNGKIFITA